MAAALLDNQQKQSTNLFAADRSLRSVFVGNIPYEASEEQLKEIFSEVGPVVSFRLVFDRETGKPKGYGFCEYKDQETALSAMRNLNGYELNGRALRVDSAASEKNKEEMRGIEAMARPDSSPHGPVVPPGEAPEAITQAVASLPPEQMFELMKQMKICIQNNPEEARQMLLQNPQLAYALLQAQVVMKIVDPVIAQSILHKPNEAAAPIQPGGPQPQQQPSGPQGPLGPGPFPSTGPDMGRRPPPHEMRGPHDQWGPGPDQRGGPDMRGHGMPPDIHDRGGPNHRDFHGPPDGPPPHGRGMPPHERGPDFRGHPDRGFENRDMRGFDPRDPRSREPPRMEPRDERRGPPMDHRDMRDPRGGPPPPEQRYGGPGGPRDPRDPRSDRGPPDRFHKGPQHSPQQQWGPPQGGPPRGPNGPGPSGPPGNIRPPGPGGPPVSSAPNVPASGPDISAQDQEKAALIMQVLSLTDQQIALLPEEQRQSIMMLKEQIGRS
ncbi:cleavage stimulation factor subunit 2 [Exaiptasia diaphana]|uniref:RRM domain-containing protein n=1 Tax=Exaiptasia diaphana TaxID=2652724 RepID=A0A913XVR8_EXADI|nr:cleavage stimulation factor subunit 2 [Exaiptasia diaphana]KXJ24390.1 Cleavage stimulation factor subunit 2 [Exaiptasia diaphana]